MAATHDAINGYAIMWLFVMFDLPTNTAAERKAAARFRKDLIKDGFGMMQFSVYIRNCASGESADMHTKRVRMLVPDEGIVSIARITDKQFSDIATITGAKVRAPPLATVQLEFF